MSCVLQTKTVLVVTDAVLATICSCLPHGITEHGSCNSNAAVRYSIMWS